MKFCWVLVVLVCGAVPLCAGQPRKLLLLAQKPDGHPPGTHEYRAGLADLEKQLAKVKGLNVQLVMADEPWSKGPELLAKADGAVVFLSEGAHWLSRGPARLKAFQELAKRGGGLSVIHWGMGTKDAKNIDAFTALFGASHGGPDRKYQVVQGRVTVGKHEITAGIEDFSVRDEFYYNLKVTKAEKLQPLLRVAIDGKDEMVAWALERADSGRSFGFSGLHFHEKWGVPEYRRFVVQGVLWTMRVPPALR